MKNLISRAEKLLISTRRTPGMYAMTKESFLNRVASIMEMVDDDFDPRAFYAKHLGTYGNTYLHTKDFPDEEWGHVVIDDALRLIKDISNQLDVVISSGETE
jgi:hypothetical protein